MSIIVPPGTIVTWKSVPSNSDGHTSTSNGDAWDSHLITPGTTWSFTFTKAGRYPYHCGLHPRMVAVVEVVAGASASSTISMGASSRPSPDSLEIETWLAEREKEIKYACPKLM
jgi:hypothetical protein